MDDKQYSDEFKLALDQLRLIEKLGLTETLANDEQAKDRISRQ